MAIMVENVLAAGVENQPPMLEKDCYDSWKIRILLYIDGKENGEMLLDSIKNGPFQFKEITVPATETTVEEKRMQELKDLSPEEKF
uniref:Ribonuclease H-like domain-containing protein n=1 Tax=Tanacetum cinerariifolium TaxID=118510 RepID=A0A6L2J6H5_TANCI|nr:ribonuclease H-like domain-containing protein [Tanacetum cinerariifolium]